MKNAIMRNATLTMVIALLLAQSDAKVLLLEMVYAMKFVTLMLVIMIMVIVPILVLMVVIVHY